MSIIDEELRSRVLTRAADICEERGVAGVAAGCILTRVAQAWNQEVEESGGARLLGWRDAGKTLFPGLTNNIVRNNDGRFSSAAARKRWAIRVLRLEARGRKLSEKEIDEIATEESRA